MEEDDDIQAQACKFPRLGNGRNEPNKLGSSRGNEAEDGELGKRVGSDGSTNRFHSTSTWHQSSRIVRVSRASGGKDRHSKVMTSKGLRDRRVRLSVTTAIQFYDLQDRLGYDQPSKAVEWLIKAASDAISELPSLNYPSFPDTPKQPSDEKRPISTLVTDHQQGFDDVDGDNTNNNYHYQNQNQNQNQSQSQNFSLSKSACSSTSETSKGSGLSLSRSEIRVKARERARERAAKEKEKENEAHIAHHHQNVNPMSQTASFTELLTGGIGSTTVSLPTTTTTTSPNGSVHQIHGGDEHNLFNKAATTTTTRQSQHWSSTVTPMVMDYFSSGLVMGPSSSRTHQTSSSTGFSGQIQLGNNSLPVSVSPFSAAENHSDQLQHFSFIPDHLIPAASGSDCNLNFTISPSLAGYNRGTLQSNSPSHQILPHHLQRFSSPIDGSNNLPFFMGGGASTQPASAAPTMDTINHHQLQFTPVFDGRLQLCYGDGTRHSDQKGKAKN